MTIMSFSIGSPQEGIPEEQRVGEMYPAGRWFYQIIQAKLKEMSSEAIYPPHVELTFSLKNLQSDVERRLDITCEVCNRRDSDFQQIVESVFENPDSFIPDVEVLQNRTGYIQVAYSENKMYPNFIFEKYDAELCDIRDAAEPEVTF